MTSFLWIIYVLAIGTAKCAEAMVSCGETLTATHGIIQTPNFPNKFSVPITCIWIVDASALTKNNVSIVVYFTQQYALSGLKFTEYLYYTEDYKVQSQQSSFVWNEDAVTQISWVQFRSPYLEIKFSMANLHGTHIRSLNRLLDVYGFNITYEMDEVKPYQCSALQCRFLGNCYARHDFSSYYCACFDGFTGDDCGMGPLCKDEKINLCENGGTCKQVGDVAITCLCPEGFKGSKCEIYDFIEEDYDSQLVKYEAHFRLENILHHIDDKLIKTFFQNNVVVIIGVYGACRRDELVNLSPKHVVYTDKFIKVSLPITKTKKIREFVIGEGDAPDVNLIQIVKKYVDLRPHGAPPERFFVSYRKGKCTKQAIGVNTIASIPKQIAIFLNLQSPAEYTGHCFRRSSASLLADAGASISELKRHAGWKLDNVVEGYIERSMNNKRKIADQIFGAKKINKSVIAGPSTTIVTNSEQINSPIAGPSHAIVTVPSNNDIERSKVRNFVFDYEHLLTPLTTSHNIFKDLHNCTINIYQK